MTPDKNKSKEEDGHGLKSLEKELNDVRIQLGEIEKKHELLYNFTPVMLHSANMEGQIIFVNDYWLQVMGYTREEVLGSKSFQYLTKESVNLYLKKIDELKKGGIIYNVEAQAKMKNGEIIDLLVSSRVIFDGEGKPEMTMTNLIVNTERKMAERALEKNVEELRVINRKYLKAKENAERNERLFRHAFEFAAFATALLGGDRKFISTNAAFKKMIGYSDEELGQMTFNDITFPEDIDAGNNLVAELVQGKRSYFWLEKRYVNKNGNIIWGLLSATLVRDSENNPIMFIAQIQDISDRKRYEKELIKAKEKAEESDRLKTAFLHNMSHEIRTPMNAIMGFAEMLPDNVHDAAKLNRFSNIIYNRCQDLLEILNDILDIAKIESGQLTFYIEKCELKSLFPELESLLKELQIRLGKKNLSFGFNLPDEFKDVEIDTDKVKLKQIFINLVSNSLKFTEKGKVDAGVKSDSNGELVFYVSDTGFGIPLECQELIYERFSQLQSGRSKSNGGTGLGLSIVKGLVQLMNGKIWLDSEPGIGTTFYFTFQSKEVV